MDLLFWTSIIGSIGILAYLAIMGITEEIKGKKFRKTLKIGDTVRVYHSDTDLCLAEVTEIKNDNLKTVVLSVTTSIDKIYPSK